MEQKPKIKPRTLIIIGLIYLVNPIDIPGPIDDIIVNILTCGIAFFLSKAQRRAEQFVAEKTGTAVDLSGVTNAVTTSVTQAASNTKAADKVNKVFSDGMKGMDSF